MCFIIPKRVKSIGKDIVITTDGVRAKKGELNIKLGDYVLVYGNIIVEKIPDSYATNTLQYIRLIGEDKS